MVTDERRAAQVRGPVAIDTVAPTDTWRQHWVVRDEQRRQRSPWAGVRA